MDNFNFPYLARNIIDFWKRWHISLSLWIKDYLYIPLGGGRNGVKRKYLNLMAAMTICGLWHGSAWTFIFWGFLHGVLLVINHSWRNSAYRSALSRFKRFYALLSWLLTFASVSILWIFFRSETIDQAYMIIMRMFCNDNSGLFWAQPFAVGVIISTVLFNVASAFRIKLCTLPLESRLTPTILLCLLWLSLVFYPKEFQPFIYSKF
jgi:alginate O-acetyltransferase complex protein AlgI